MEDKLGIENPIPISKNKKKEENERRTELCIW